MMDTIIGADKVMKTVQESDVRSWGAVDHAAIWAAAIENSVRAEAATARSLADKGSPDLFVVMSGNRVSGTILGVLKVPELRGSRGCIVSYPHKSAFVAHRFNDPAGLDFGRLIHITRRLAGDPSGAGPLPMWYAHEGGFERLEGSVVEGSPRISAGPVLRGAMTG